MDQGKSYATVITSSARLIKNEDDVYVADRLCESFSG